jgi:hypothetical protein
MKWEPDDLMHDGIEESGRILIWRLGLKKSWFAVMMCWCITGIKLTDRLLDLTKINSL